MKPLKLLFLIGLLLKQSIVVAQTDPKPRIIITADPELDDNNSMIRFLMYSSDYQIEGLIYASSQFHWKGDGKGTKWFVPGREYDRFNMGVCPCESWRWAKDERFIHNIVEAYAKSYPNLKIHNKNYPSPEYLKSKIRYGNIEFDGDYSKDTPGSELIKSIILDNKPGQVFITAWGGASTIARALKSIQDQYEFTAEWTNLKNKISRKVVLLPSGDQDDTFASYIRPNWSEIEYRQFRDSPNYGYGAQLRAKDQNKPYLTPVWMKENVTSRGAIGELYRVWGDGKQMVENDKVDYFGMSGYSSDELKKMGYFVWMPPQEKNSWLGEGDNHTFMNMLGNGLRAYEKDFYGGWGGRALRKNEAGMFANLSEGSAEQMAAQMGTTNQQDSNEEVPFPDFFIHAQNSFSARLKWSVSPKFSDANHEPLILLQNPLKIMGNAGQKIKLNSVVSDPDNDSVAIKWWQMPSGSYKNKVEINHVEPSRAEVLLPKEMTAGQSIHVIIEATDSGSPTLTSYQRVIIEIRNK
jgi:hypothetical protein